MNWPHALLSGSDPWASMFGSRHRSCGLAFDILHVRVDRALNT